MQEEFRADKGHFYFANVLQKSVYGTLKFTCLDPVKADTGRGFGGDTLQVFLKSKVEVLREGHKKLRNHHFRFDVYCISTVKSKVEISQNFLAFSECLNFKTVKNQYCFLFVFFKP